MSGEAERQHVVPASLYVNIWIALVLLTALTVGASYVNLRNVAIVAAVLIATVKASLVVLYFMHLRFEPKIYAIILLTSLGFLAVCFLLTFVDYSFR